MLKRSTWRLIVCALFLFALAGCGSGDSETNGSLALSVSTPTLIAANTYEVVSTATYTNVQSSQGVPIRMRVSVHTQNGPAQVTDTELNADSFGTVTTYTTVVQTNEAQFVDVTATTGGLSQTKTVAVPAAP